jgi:hypothetical protein
VSLFSTGTFQAGHSKFVRTKVLPDTEIKEGIPEDALYRFLIFLLPVDTKYELDSEAYSTFLLILEANREYAVRILIDSLSFGFTQHLPSVWRLLTVAEQIEHSKDAYQIALARVGTAQEAALRRELERYLSAAKRNLGEESK